MLTFVVRLAKWLGVALVAGIVIGVSWGAVWDRKAQLEAEQMHA